MSYGTTSQGTKKKKGKAVDFTSLGSLASQGLKIVTAPGRVVDGAVWSPVREGFQAMDSERFGGTASLSEAFGFSGNEKSGMGAIFDAAAASGRPLGGTGKIGGIPVAPVFRILTEVANSVATDPVSGKIKLGVGSVRFTDDVLKAARGIDAAADADKLASAGRVAQVLRKMDIGAGETYRRGTTSAMRAEEVIKGAPGLLTKARAETMMKSGANMSDDVKEALGYSSRITWGTGDAVFTIPGTEKLGSLLSRVGGIPGEKLARATGARNLQNLEILAGRNPGDLNREIGRNVPFLRGQAMVTLDGKAGPGIDTALAALKGQRAAGGLIARFAAAGVQTFEENLPREKAFGRRALSGRPDAGASLVLEEGGPVGKAVMEAKGRLLADLQAQGIEPDMIDSFAARWDSEIRKWTDEASRTEARGFGHDLYHKISDLSSEAGGIVGWVERGRILEANAIATGVSNVRMIGEVEEALGLLGKREKEIYSAVDEVLGRNVIGPTRAMKTLIDAVQPEDLVGALDGPFSQKFDKLLGSINTRSAQKLKEAKNARQGVAAAEGAMPELQVAVDRTTAGLVDSAAAVKSAAERRSSGRLYETLAEVPSLQAQAKAASTARFIPDLKPGADNLRMMEDELDPITRAVESSKAWSSTNKAAQDIIASTRLDGPAKLAALDELHPGYRDLLDDVFISARKAGRPATLEDATRAMSVRDVELEIAVSNLGGSKRAAELRGRIDFLAEDQVALTAKGRATELAEDKAAAVFTRKQKEVADQVRLLDEVRRGAPGPSKEARLAATRALKDFKDGTGRVAKNKAAALSLDAQQAELERLVDDFARHLANPTTVGETVVAKGMVRLYRGEARQVGAKPQPQWMQDILATAPTDAGSPGANTIGRWFTASREEAMAYLRPPFAEAGDMKALQYVDVPREVAEASVHKSINGTTEHLLPKEWAVLRSPTKDFAGNVDQLALDAVKASEISVKEAMLRYNLPHLVGPDADAGYLRAFAALEKQHLKKFGDTFMADPHLAYLFNPKSDGAEFNKITQLWKAYAILRPGFSNRNFIGAYINNKAFSTKLRDYRDAAIGFAAIEKGTALPAWAAEMRLPEAAERIIKSGLLNDITKGAAIRLGNKTIIGSLFAERAGGVMDKYALAKAMALMGGKGTDGTRIGMGVATMTGVEDNVRLALYIRLSKEGVPFDRAVETVYATHFDYTDLSAFDKSIRKFVPFWTYRSRSLPLQATLFMSHPHLSRSLWLTREDNKSEGHNGDNLPPWLAGLAMPWGDTVINLNNYLPGSDIVALGDAFTRLPKDTTQISNIASSFIGGPALSGAEIIFNKKLFSGMPVMDRQASGPDQWGQLTGYLASQIGTASDLGITLPRILANLAPGGASSEDVPRKLARWGGVIPTFTDHAAK